VTHSEAKNPTRLHARPHTRSHPVRTVRILRPLAPTPTHRGADGAAVCIPLWDRRVASKKWRCSARRPGRIQSSMPRKILHQVPAISFHVLPVEIADPCRGVSARPALPHLPEQAAQPVGGIKISRTTPWTRILRHDSKI